VSSWEQRVLSVDLTDSRLGPLWRSTEIQGDWPQAWEDDRLRQECANHYAIPVEQVTVHYVADDVDACYRCDRIICYYTDGS
jgi:hypothetical protein